MKRLFSTKKRIILSVLFLAFVVFFLNPWALDAMVTRVKRGETPNFWYYFYYVEPAILERHPEKFPWHWEDNPGDSENRIIKGCRDKMTIIPIGSIFFLKCPDNGNIALDWVFGIAQPSHLKMYIKTLIFGPDVPCESFTIQTGNSFYVGCR